MQTEWNKKIKIIFQKLNLPVDVDFPQTEPWELLTLLEESLRISEDTIEGEVDNQVIIEDYVYIEKGAKIKAPCRIKGPLYLGSDSVIGPFANIRGPVIIDNNCVIGSTEVKNSILFSGSHAEHHSYIGDSLIGRDVNIGAGCVLANLRLDKEEIVIKKDAKKYPTGREKFGAVLEDNVSLGANCVLNPGVYLEEGKKVYPGKII
ncbi:MAG TPA: hypothetical protein VKO42_00690 [Patescibacteria group bacterium]|nr:hypothetical protein [Patescibacteria group bacterium]